jgi:large subunit ribosomal protein L6
MSKLAKKPLQIPSDVKVSINNGICLISNKKDSINLKYNTSLVEIKIDGNLISVLKKNESKDSISQTGTIFRTIQTSLVGLSPIGFTFNVTLKGVGYKATLSGSTLFLTLGYSHNIALEVPKTINLTVEKNITLIVKSYSKSEAMDFVRSVQRLRTYNVYKGSGVLLEKEWRVVKEMKKSKK